MLRTSTEIDSSYEVVEVILRKGDPSQVGIKDLRLSFIWVETLFDMLRDAQPAGAPMAFLGRSHLYAAQFAAMPAGLGPPWPKPSKHNFWRYYLQCDPFKMPASQAWRFLVPFRRVPLSVRGATPALRVIAEGFYYPHGIGLIVTLTDTTDRALFDAVAASFLLRTDACVVVDDGAGGRAVTLDQCADECFDSLRAAAYGAAVKAGVRSLDPFTVVTVVQAAGVDTGPLVTGGPVHRSLEAWTGWRTSWKTDALSDPAKTVLTTSGGGSRALYASRRGRAVWFPDRFTVPGRALSCYHRNLALSSLQVESLGAAVTRTLAVSGGDLTTLSVHHTDSVGYSTDMLGRFYGAPATTYRGWSAPRQITDGDLVTPTNKLRDLMSKPPIFVAA